jgi:hypothetical protein
MHNLCDSECKNYCQAVHGSCIPVIPALRRLTQLNQELQNWYMLHWLGYNQLHSCYTPPAMTLVWGEPIFLVLNFDVAVNCFSQWYTGRRSNAPVPSQRHKKLDVLPLILSYLCHYVMKNMFWLYLWSSHYNWKSLSLVTTDLQQEAEPNIHWSLM